jgi:hypothetical protein
LGLKLSSREGLSYIPKALNATTLADEFSYRPWDFQNLG